MPKKNKVKLPPRVSCPECGSRATRQVTIYVAAKNGSVASTPERARLCLPCKLVILTRTTVSALAKKPKRATKRVNLRDVPLDVYEQLLEAAEAEGVSLNRLINEHLAEHFSE